MAALIVGVAKESGPSEMTLPQGFEIPEDTQVGETFEAVVTFKKDGDNTATPVEVDGVPFKSTMAPTDGSDDEGQDDSVSSSSDGSDSSVDDSDVGGDDSTQSSPSDAASVNPDDGVDAMDAIKARIAKMRKPRMMQK